MVNSVSNTPQAPKTTKTSIFYINDFHSNFSNLEKIRNAAVDFDQYTPKDVVKLKFASGDIGAGRDSKVNQVATETENLIGIMATPEGNHEFDTPKKGVLTVLETAKYKVLGANVRIPQTSEENKKISEKLIKSYIQEQNGEKFGVIGIMPEDFLGRVSDPKEYADFDMETSSETIATVQKEIDALKKQGIDKIILLSHNGYDKDVKLVQAVEGLDVILGGHSHDLLEGIKENKNLFYSKKTGEPTIITQAGKDGKHFGVLNLEFNSKGVITNAQNNVNKTENLPKSLLVTRIIDKLLGKPEYLGMVSNAPKGDISWANENATANFLTDIIKSELGVDLAAVNIGNIRENIGTGPLTTRDLQLVTPFSNKIWIVKYSEADIVNAVKVSASSISKDDPRPGFLHFSGLKYTLSKNGDVKSITFSNKNGKETSIDIKNPNPFKTYRVAVDDFVAIAGNNYFVTKPEMVEMKFDFDKTKTVTDYLRKHKDPIEIKLDGRITIVD